MKYDEIAGLIGGCSSLENLFELWQGNYDKWKKRKDFKAIMDIKDCMKFRLSWVNTISDAMCRYNTVADAFETSPDVETAIELNTEGELLEAKIYETISRAVDLPMGTDGIELVKVFNEWHENPEQLKFKLEC